MYPLSKDDIDWCDATVRIFMQSRTSDNIDDYLSLGRESLVKAAHTYDPSRDAKFRSYAHMRITNDLISFIRQELYFRHGDHHRERKPSTLSLDSLPTNLLSLSHDGLEHSVHIKHFYEKFLRSLSNRKALIVDLYCKEGYTGREIAKHFNCTPSRISQIIIEARAKAERLWQS